MPMRNLPLRFSKLLAVGVAGLTLASCAGTDSATPGNGIGPGDQAQGTSGTTFPVADPNLDSDVALDPFESCDELVGWIKEQALAKVTPYGLEGYGTLGYRGGDVVMESADGRSDIPSAPVSTTAPSATGGNEGSQSLPATGEGKGTSADPASPDFSGTNNQEAGVDEPDTMKTDGSRLFTVMDDRIVSYVDLDTTPRQVGALRLNSDGGGNHQLLLDGDRLLVLTTSYNYYDRPMPMEDATAEAVAPANGPYTTIRTIDVADSALMKLTERVEIDGNVVSARLVGGQMRVVTSSHPATFDFVSPNGRGAEDAAESANRRIIEESKVEDWLPRMYVYGDGAARISETKPLLGCNSVSRPKEYAGLGVLSVLTINADGAVDPAANVGVMGDGETVYASSSSLYVTTNQPEELVRRGTPEFHTAVHKFDITGNGAAVYRASGKFDGALLNQFSMSELGGVLRAATTTSANGTGASSGSESQVVTLREEDGELQVIGQVGGLGKNESIRSVRFIGDMGYVVTFRQTDPLYTIDLRDPTDPKVAGELKILGYSAYLHPVGDGLVLGVGQDATEQGRLLGTQVQLFDVKDPANPTAIQKLVIPGANSEAETDHHAFLWWTADNLAVIPVTKYGYGVSSCPPGSNCVDEGKATPSTPFLGVVGFTVTPEGITEVGEIQHLSTTGSGSNGSGGCTADECAPVPPTTIWCPDGSGCERVIEPTIPISPPVAQGVQITRSLVVGPNLITLSSGGLKSSDLATFAEKAWLPLT